MEATFKSYDEDEIKRIAKSRDMANFIFELVYNGWREFEDTDYDYTRAWKKIEELLERFKITPHDLTC